MISLIVAVSDNDVIGYDNQLPWHISEDLKHFKELTVDTNVIMGRKCYESIGKPLPNRNNIILTRNQSFTAPGCSIAHNIHDALFLRNPTIDTFIIGGADIYKLFLPLVDKIYLTRVHITCKGDTFFPHEFLNDWVISENSTLFPNGGKVFKEPFSFIEYTKITK